MTRDDIARWLQQADEELLYTPDGAAPLTGSDSGATVSIRAWCVACGGRFRPGDTLPTACDLWLFCPHLWVGVDGLAAVRPADTGAV